MAYSSELRFFIFVVLNFFNVYVIKKNILPLMPHNLKREIGGSKGHKELKPNKTALLRVKVGFGPHYAL
ncbi:MAG: hypothetical protein LBV23_01005 [Deltaproteobacteria bacterium]|jgi:hypothetical protein|nr:hypothetical protein [Deltaproteobacteria bacterium]